MTYKDIVTVRDKDHKIDSGSIRFDKWRADGSMR